MKFSERIGKTSSIKNLQIDSMDEDLRNCLWNVTKLFFLDKLTPTIKRGSSCSFYGSVFHKFCMELWHNFYKLTTDRIPYGAIEAKKYIREKYFKIRLARNL